MPVSPGCLPLHSIEALVGFLKLGETIHWTILRFRVYLAETCSFGRAIFRMTEGMGSFLLSIEMKFQEIEKLTSGYQ